MTTYICKCGRTFQKNTGAGTTGFRMPDYGPAHECYGCPFVQKERWREGGRDIDAYACRGSKVLDYQTDAYCCDSKGAALHVRTLDLQFIQTFFKDYLALPGHTYDKLYHGMDSPENGRQQYSFGFAANKQGEADRKALTDRYFRSEGEQPGVLPSGCDRLVRKDVTPEQEKEIVLNQIREAKAMAQGIKEEQAPTEAPATEQEAEGARAAQERMILPNGSEDRRLVLKAVHENMPCQAVHICDDQPDNVKIWLNEIESHEGPDSEFWVMNRDGEAGGEQIDRCPYCGAGLKWGAGDVAIVNVAPESGNGGADSADGADETPDSGDDAGNSENDDTEQPPYDWKNASGADEDEEEGDNQAEATGDPLSLRGPEFGAIIATADTVLNRLVAMLHAKKQRDGEMTVKVTFEDANGAGSYIFSGAVSGKINYTVKPQKIVGDAVELQFDAQGNPTVPADRERQLSFDETPGGTAQVDGQTGIVEEYHPDDEEDQAPDEAGGPAEDDSADDDLI